MLNFVLIYNRRLFSEGLISDICCGPLFLFLRIPAFVLFSDIYLLVSEPISALLVYFLFLT